MYKTSCMFKRCVHGCQRSCFKMKSNVFWILWSYQYFFHFIIRINDFRGERTDVSAKKSTLMVLHILHAVSAGNVPTRVMDPVELAHVLSHSLNVVNVAEPWTCTVSHDWRSQHCSSDGPLCIQSSNQRLEPFAGASRTAVPYVVFVIANISVR